MDFRFPFPLETPEMINVLTNILNEIDAYVYVSDMETDEILFVNRKMKETFGIDHDTTGAICWKVIQQGVNGRCSYCPIHKLEKDPGTPVVWEERNTVTGRYYKNTDSVIEWIDGRKVHLEYSIDITDAKAVQQENANSLEVLKNILNGMDAYVYVSDMANDEILFINKHMQEAFGLGDDAVGRTCWKVLQSGFTERCSFCPNKRLENHPDIPVVWEEHNTVTKRHYKNVDSVIEWMDGKLVHMQHSTDITDIVEAQREIREARERLEIALTSSQAGVWELVFDANRLTYDAMCAKLFGFDAERTSMTVDSLLAHLEMTVKGESGGDLLRSLRERDPYSQHSSRDFHLVFPDGSERHVRNYGYTMRDTAGLARRVIGMCIDISQHVTMERDLMAAKVAAEHASMAKSQFLSIMSHEIRTPMNAIIGMTEILLNDALNDRQRHYMNDIKVSSTALLSIINDILDFSKIEAGKLQLIPVDYNIFQLLENLESMFSFAAESKNIFFYLDIQDKIPTCLHGDDIRLRQALINVIGNAVKFTREGGVSMTVRVEGGMLAFDIADTGVGIKPEDINSIFKDFGQLDTRNNRNIAGTGLGLSITKNLIAMMSGAITVESEYGKGTVFHLRVPLIPGNEENMISKTRMFEFIDAPEAAVLVVDDNEVNLNVASGLLGLSGIACDTAASGWEAIRKIADRRYDIVFMDHMMPEMDGVETTRVLREHCGESELVIVALTANAVDGARESLLGARMNDYLSKPIDKLELNRILRKWLPPGKVRDRREAPPPVDIELETADGLSLLLERVGTIDGVNIKLGLERIGCLRDAYAKSVEIMARRLPEVMERLASFLEQGDLKGFSIEVHGAKGSLNNIGATRMAEAAEALESKAKENDLDSCRQHLPALLADLETLGRGLREALAEQEAAGVPAEQGDPAALVRELPEIRRLLDAFEADAALEILQRLAGFDHGAEPNEALRGAIRAIEEFDCDRAVAALEGL